MLDDDLSISTEDLAEAALTPDHIALVQETFKSVAEISEQAAELFYNRLFEIDPALKALFKNDLKEQGRLLMAMIATAVNGLNDLDAIVPAVQDLGVRHAGYGVKTVITTPLPKPFFGHWIKAWETLIPPRSRPPGRRSTRFSPIP